MPVMGGFEACMKIRDHMREDELLSLEMMHHPYIVALSASCISQSLEMQCRKAGFDD